jgi:hypothetical protein
VVDRLRLPVQFLVRRPVEDRAGLPVLILVLVQAPTPVNPLAQVQVLYPVMLPVPDRVLVPVTPLVAIPVLNLAPLPLRLPAFVLVSHLVMTLPLPQVLYLV